MNKSIATTLALMFAGFIVFALILNQVENKMEDRVELCKQNVENCQVFA